MRKRTVISGGKIGLSLAKGLANSSYYLPREIILPRIKVAARYHPENKMDKIASPNGGAIAGLNEMEHQGFSSTFIKEIKGPTQLAGGLYDE